MQQLASRQLSRDYALDYLFQESVEEQFEALRLIQSQSAPRLSLMSRISQWFRGGSKPQESHQEYWKDN